jgi:hypothetical protein
MSQGGSRDDWDKVLSLDAGEAPRRSSYAHGTSPLEKIDLANQSWHVGAASGRGSPLHSLGPGRTCEAPLFDLRVWWD